jgi:hypothetical protein
VIMLTKTVTLNLEEIAIIRASLSARLFELENCLNCGDFHSPEGQDFIKNEIRITKDATATMEIGDFK